MLTVEKHQIRWGGGVWRGLCGGTGGFRRVMNYVVDRVGGDPVFS